MENQASWVGEYEAIFRAHYDPADSGADAAFLALKNAGASVLRSKAIACKVLLIDLQEADYLVLNSTAWCDQREAIEAGRERFWELSEDESETI